jgi:hypothetical protein
VAENFQDNVAYGGSTFSISGDALVIGASNTNATSKTLFFNNNSTSGALVWGPSANRTISLPDASGVVLLSSQGVLSVSAGGAQVTSGQLIFSNSNGVSFGVNGQTITATIATSLTNINFSAGTTSSNLSAIVFSNSNNVSFGLNGATVTATISVPAQTNQTVGLYGLGNTTQNSSTTLDARTLSFNGAGIITVGYSNGSIQLSATTAAQTVQTIGLYGLGNTTQNSSTTLDARTLSFNGLGMITVGYSNGSIQISATQTNQTEGLYAIGNTTGQSSSSTFDARTLSVSGAGIASVGYSGNALVISVPSGAALINFSAGTTSGNLGAIVFSNSNNVSFGINGSTITATATFAQSAQTEGMYAVGNTAGQSSSSSFDARTQSVSGAGVVSVGYSNNALLISAPAFAVSRLQVPEFAWMTNFSISNMSQSFQAFNPKANMTITQANLLMGLSGNTNSTGALTISMGIYTWLHSTLSLASSNSRQITWTSGSQTNSSSVYGGISGTMYRTISLANWAITPGDYMIGLWFRTTNNGNWVAFGQEGPSIVNAQDVNETQVYLNGYTISSYSTGMIASVNVTDTGYARTGGDALKQAGMIFLGSF